MRKKPDRYVFPAIFSYDNDGVAVSFPDLPGCNTCGNDQSEAINMAQDALAGHLSCLEDDGDPIPVPSDLRAIHAEKNEVVAIIEAWMLPLREKTIRKNLTIPSKLAYQAEKAGINFSQVLTSALEKELRNAG
ncbi:MAG: type II toxin-antitoxin system HicB family antitoxin [Synergistaceae bacterium]|jgi:predicted RNase H-like HicB family nuclease|nr:type II toxin-antitoxin system HicB family antitoxin [Synergistaceae bacterium]